MKRFFVTGGIFQYGLPVLCAVYFQNSLMRLVSSFIRTRV